MGVLVRSLSGDSSGVGVCLSCYEAAVGAGDFAMMGRGFRTSCRRARHARRAGAVRVVWCALAAILAIGFAPRGGATLAAAGAVRLLRLRVGQPGRFLPADRHRLLRHSPPDRHGRARWRRDGPLDRRVLWSRSDDAAAGRPSRRSSPSRATRPPEYASRSTRRARVVALPSSASDSGGASGSIGIRSSSSRTSSRPTTSPSFRSSSILY